MARHCSGRCGVPNETAVLQVLALVQLDYGGIFAPRHADHEEVVQDLLVVVQGPVALEATGELDVHPVARVLRVHLVHDRAALREVRQDHAGGGLRESEHGDPTIGGILSGCGGVVVVHLSGGISWERRGGEVVLRSWNDALPAGSGVVQRLGLLRRWWREWRRDLSMVVLLLEWQTRRRVVDSGRGSALNEVPLRGQGVE